MSFRGRLTLFFVLIVVVPMISVAVVLSILLDRSEEGKIGAAVSARQFAAQGLVDEAQSEANPAARAIAQDARLAAALRAGDDAALRRRLEVLRRRTDATRAVVLRRGRALASAGRPDAVWPVTNKLVDERGREVARLQVATRAADEWAQQVHRVTGAEVVLRRNGELLASTVGRLPPGFVPPVTQDNAPGSVTIGGIDYRGSTTQENDFLAARGQITVLYEPSSDQADSRLWGLGILVGFFALACTFALIVSRSLQEKVYDVLQAARRLGKGELGVEVPVKGGDEFAALGQEFNNMADQLEDRLGELSHERTRVIEATQRIGEIFLATLDRPRLLSVLARTAKDGVRADGSRVTLLEGPDVPAGLVTTAGGIDGLESAIHAAELGALENGHPTEVAVGDAYAMAHPLRGEAPRAPGAADGPAATDVATDGARRDPGVVTGVIAVARRGRPFSAGEKELFGTLAVQSVGALANVALHEQVERQAVTDALTGLANRRAFDRRLKDEVERARRFEDPLAVVLLDLDDFKVVNDEHGHRVGDLVLRAVADVVRETSREVDTPARYGGEELAIVLPATDLDGAEHLAERIRDGVARLSVPLPDGGQPLRITTSLGVATMPGAAHDAASLVEAADDALYRAKRGGKNRTVLAA